MNEEQKFDPTRVTKDNPGDRALDLLRRVDSNSPARNLHLRGERAVANSATEALVKQAEDQAGEGQNSDEKQYGYVPVEDQKTLGQVYESRIAGEVTSRFQGTAQADTDGSFKAAQSRLEDWREIAPKKPEEKKKSFLQKLFGR